MVREARRRRGRGPATRRGDDRQGHRDHPVAQARDGHAPPLEGGGRRQGPPRPRRDGARRRCSRGGVCRSAAQAGPAAGGRITAVHSRRRGPGSRGRGRSSRRSGWQWQGPRRTGRVRPRPRAGSRHPAGGSHRAREQGHEGRRARPVEHDREGRCRPYPAGCGRPPPWAPWRSSRSAVCAWRIAEKMALSKRTAAHFTFVEQVDATELVSMKNRMAKGAAPEGVRVTFLPFVLKAAVAALRKFPQLNASFDEQREEYPPQALVRPRNRRCDTRGSPSRWSGAPTSSPWWTWRARSNGWELTAGPGGCVRRTSGTPPHGHQPGRARRHVRHPGDQLPRGRHPGRASHPPHAVARDGQVVIRDVMYVSLTSDHRVVDGTEAAAFTHEVIRTSRTRPCSSFTRSSG